MEVTGKIIVALPEVGGTSQKGNPPTCHIQPTPLPAFPQLCLFGYTSAVLSVL